MRFAVLLLALLAGSCVEYPTAMVARTPKEIRCRTFALERVSSAAADGIDVKFEPLIAHETYVRCMAEPSRASFEEGAR